MNLWGNRENLDFWTAKERGEVPEPEQRAMSLLAEICDLNRVNMYCSSGYLPAMGNISRRTYLIPRRGKIVELDSNGGMAFHWCIHVDNCRSVPPTDNVIAIRNVLEGSEAAFRKIGNKSKPLSDVSSRFSGMEFVPEADREALNNACPQIDYRQRVVTATRRSRRRFVIPTPTLPPSVVADRRRRADLLMRYPYLKSVIDYAERRRAKDRELLAGLQFELDGMGVCNHEKMTAWKKACMIAVQMGRQIPPKPRLETPADLGMPANINVREVMMCRELPEYLRAPMEAHLRDIRNRMRVAVATTTNNMMARAEEAMYNAGAQVCALEALGIVR